MFPTKYRTTYEDLRRNSRGETSEFVAVPENAIGFVIGKKGSTIKQIEEKSGAKINRIKTDTTNGFIVYGSEDQRACARELINQKVVSRTVKMYLVVLNESEIIGNAKECYTSKSILVELFMV